MSKQQNIVRELSAVFEVQQAEAIAKVVTAAYEDLVKTSDFNELKAIVKELATAQVEMKKEMQALATAQVRTELRVEELAQAQVEMKQAQVEMQKEMRILAQRVGETNSTLGGLGQSVAYALENEAYRMLPALLAEKYDIHLNQRLIRTDIGGEEINIFGRGQRDGQEVLVVGETKLRLDERHRSRLGRKHFFDQLEAKAQAVRTVYPEPELVLLIITHYARPSALQQAEEAGIIVVQSFEW